MGNDRVSNRWQRMLEGRMRRLAAVTNRPAACAPQISEFVFIRVHSWLRKLRRASNKGTLRAFRNANRFTTFKILAGRALFDDVSPEVGSVRDMRSVRPKTGENRFCAGTVRAE